MCCVNLGGGGGGISGQCCVNFGGGGGGISSRQCCVNLINIIKMKNISFECNERNYLGNLWCESKRSQQWIDLNLDE